MLFVRSRSVLRLSALAALLLLTSAPPALAQDSVYQQRSKYRTALDHLTAGRSRAFERSRLALKDYALAPYLDYHALQSRLSSASAGEVVAFRREHADLPVADIIFYRWLKRLGRQRAWSAFLTHYEPGTSAELRCYYLRALYGTGKRQEAYDQVDELWLVGRSQPKACDPLFEAWIAAGNLTESMVWQRLKLALDSNKRTLARYLQRFFESDLKQLAQSYYNVHVTPSGITRTNRFSTDNVYSRDVIRHGLKRLARRDPEAAAKAWQRYEDSHSFSDDERTEIAAAIIVGAAREGDFPAQGESMQTLPDDATVAMAEAAITRENWPQAAYWVDRIGGDTRQERRWQYWLARSLASTVLSSDRARLTFEALAQERDYYGFLAAEQIGRELRLNQTPLQLSPIRTNQLRRKPAVARAVELYAVGDFVNARREWRELLPGLNNQEREVAAALAQAMGWTSQSIRTASDPTLRDTLELRFPLAFQDSFNRVSTTTAVSKSFLLAVARQESAFDPRARSSANARGLMQLMHPTATDIARRVGVPSPTAAELYDPTLNVELAGHHLAALLERYEQQRPLAAAAYNAGEARVARWTKNREGMAMDVWIEAIPFRETRNYVKNVLAFDQVYSQLMAAPKPMLKVHETALN